jgi:3-oxoacyl-[acyl-carrier-protein] synthase-3
VARNIRVLATGAYLPERVLTNADLEAMVDTSDEWIRTRTGIRERHIAAPEEAASDLAYQASRQALERASVSPEEVDVIVLATSFGDMPFPATACLLQRMLGARRACAFDVQAGCTGFVYALHVARALLASGQHRTALVAAGEALSRLTDWTDRSTCVLLGDAGGAMVLRAEELPGDSPVTGVLSSCLGSDGEQWELLHMPAGGSRLPASHETVERRLHYFKMRGSETFKVATRVMGEAAEEAIRQAGLSLADVDLLVPHQANLRIISAMAKRLELPMERVVVTVDHLGNTSSASIPVSVDEAQREGRIRAGTTAVFVSFGAGLTWGSAVVRF